MDLHLQEIAGGVAPGKHAVVLLDQAGWHLSGRLIVPPNITLIPLPPKCPEINPQENVWQFIRENWLSNRVFKPFDDIVDHCCAAWNKLVDQPWKFMSIVHANVVRAQFVRQCLCKAVHAAFRSGVWRRTEYSSAALRRQ